MFSTLHHGLVFSAINFNFIYVHLIIVQVSTLVLISRFKYDGNNSLNVLVT